MVERELTARQFMAPDAYPATPGEGQRVTALHSAALAAILAAPVLLCMVAL